MPPKTQLAELIGERDELEIAVEEMIASMTEFGTRRSQAQNLPLRPVISLILNGFLKRSTAAFLTATETANETISS